MTDPEGALAAFDRAVARLEAARSLLDLERVFVEEANGPLFLGAAYAWWSHPPPARHPDLSFSGGVISHAAPVAAESASELWATSLPAIAKCVVSGEKAAVDVRVALLGPPGRFGVLDLSLALDISDVRAAGSPWRARFLLLAHVIQQGVSELSPDKRPALGRREIQCLKLAAEGLKAKQIASALGIGQQTVQFHLSRAREKLDCSNTVQAVARAAQFGLLPDIAPLSGPQA